MRTGVWIATAALLVCGSAHAQAIFELLPLAPTMRNAGARSVSSDGNVIVGTGNGPVGTDTLAFRWDAGGAVQVSPLPGYALVSACGASGDGGAIVGDDFSADYGIATPYVWRSGTLPVALPLLPGHVLGFAYGISRDGSTIVGSSGVAPPGQAEIAVAWRAGTITSLGVAGGFTVSRALGVSGDGSVVVGDLLDPVSGREGAFRWTAAGGMVVLPTLEPNGWAIAEAVSDDGRVTVGSGGADSPFTHHAMRWRSGSAPEDLGVPIGYTWSDAAGVSGDGRIVVGGIGDAADQRAFVFTDQTGMLDLTQFLTSRGVDLHGRYLQNCACVTPDGDTLVGTERDSQAEADSGAWRLRIPGWFCYANCDSSSAPPMLNISDFQCFLNNFAAGDPYANCDGSTAPPVLNINDFQCFLNKFVAGCS